MGKEKKHNEFYFFMLDRKAEVEKRLGRTVPMSEMPQHVTAEWKSLPESKKKKYTVMKEKQNKSVGKLDCRGRPLKEIEEEMETKRRKEEDMKKDIGGMVDLYHAGNALPKATFYIFSCSYYIHTDDGRYIPAELGVLQFNLLRGIIKEHNIILKPIILPTYGFLAQQHSEDTHNLLDENNINGRDLDEALKELCEFVVEEKNKIPPLYTLEEEMKQAEGVLNYIGADDHFKIYSLELLFQHIYVSTFQGQYLPISVSQEMLTHCGLDYHPNMACLWHVMNHPDFGKHCTLSCARRWVFLMCDNLNLEETYGIIPKEGKHLPRAVPARGVIVDVPRTSFKDDIEGASATSARKPQQAAGKIKDDSFSFTPSKLQPATSVGTVSLPAASPWDPVVAEAPGGSDTSCGPKWSQAKSSTAASLFAPPSLNTYSEDDFPSLGAGRAKIGQSGHEELLNTLGGVGRGMTLDQLYTGTLGVGRGQRTFKNKKNKQ